MSIAFFYALVGVGLFSIGFYGLVVHAHLLRKILAINVMGNGVFLILVALAKRTGNPQPDAVPLAMVITGIVVAVSATALALSLMSRLNAETGRTDLQNDQQEDT